MRILLVEDEPSAARMMAKGLREQTYAVDVAQDGEGALYQANVNDYDLIILDIMLPGKDGFEVCRELRAAGSPVPVLMVTARDTIDDRVEGLDTGADDYLTKPFGVEELVARVRVALRHSARPALDPVFRTGDLVVDLDKRRVFVAGEEVRLTPTEYALLVMLVRNADRVVTDAGLLRQVWGPEYGDEDHYLHVYVARLRKKIERDPQNPRYLRTEPGVGYRLLTESP